MLRIALTIVMSAIWRRFWLGLGAFVVTDTVAEYLLANPIGIGSAPLTSALPRPVCRRKVIAMASEPLIFPGSRPAGGGGGSDMEARLARVEVDVDYIKRDVRDLRTDFREMREEGRAHRAVTTQL